MRMETKELLCALAAIYRSQQATRYKTKQYLCAYLVVIRQASSWYHELKYTGYPTTYINNYFSWTLTDLPERLLQITPSTYYHISDNFYKIIYKITRANVRHCWTRTGGRSSQKKKTIQQNTWYYNTIRGCCFSSSRKKKNNNYKKKQ